MDYRATKSGFAREVQMRILEKYNAEEAAKTLKWITLFQPAVGIPQEVLDAVKQIPPDISSVKPEDYHNFLKNGLVLGYLIGCLKPEEAAQRLGKTMWKVCDKPIFETTRQRERIGSFLNFCAEMGVGSASLFQTDQLHEQTNLPQVIIALSELGVEAQTKPGYAGPEGFWMTRPAANRRTFTEEQLKGGEAVIGLQMGFAGGANQSGLTFGAHRQVTDTF